MMLTLFLEADALKSIKLSPEFVKDGDYMGIKILDAKEVTFDKVDGFDFYGISDIHYDAKRKLLYALNDRGVFYTLEVKIDKGKIESLHLKSAQILKDKDGHTLPAHYRDSESMVVQDDAIMIAFEYHPRVTEFDKHLHEKKEIAIPYKLRDIQSYQGKNDALEALTYDVKLGWITASEYPLLGQKQGHHDIYTKKGKHCAIKRERYNAIVEMEMMPDGALLLLQRKFRWQDMSMATTLSKVHIQNPKNGICKVDLLAWMSTKEGWNIDNFEGLTRYHDQQYLMISDDNGNFFQKTILTLFEIKE